MKNRARRILALLLAALMTLALAACGKSGTDGKPGKTDDGDHPDFVYTAEYKDFLDETENSLSPRIFTDDGYYSISWEKIGENIPEGVTPRYEGEYDVYGSFLYFVSFDGKAEKLANYQSLEPETDDGSRKEFSSSSDINGMCLTDDGRIAIVENRYSSWSEAPDGVTRNSDDYWQYRKYEQSYFVRWLESDGTEISTAQMQINTDDGWLDCYRMQLDDQDNVVCIYNGNQICAFGADGTVSYSIESDDYFDCLVSLAGGKLGVGRYGQNGQELVLVDAASKSLGESYPIRADLYNAIPGSNGYDLYYTSGTNFYGMKLESGEPEKLFSWLNCDVNGDRISSVSVHEDGSVQGVITDWDNKTETYSYELVTVKQVPYESVPHKEIITLGTMSMDYRLPEMIVDFNRSNDQYRIEVTDYSEYSNTARAAATAMADAASGGEDSWNAGLTKFNTEIMAGNVPDIIDVSSLNYVQLASKGIIADLYPYIDADPELNRSDFFENVLHSMEVDGKLCATVSGFYINTVMGASSVVGDTPGWTYDEFMQALATMPEGCEPFDRYVTRDSILQTCLALDLDTFVNWGTGECRFDSPEFVDLLEFAALFPETFDWENYDYSNEDSTTERLAQGKQMLVQSSFYSIEYMYDSQYVESLGGKVTYIGFPTVSGTGNMLSIDGSSYAMSSKSEHKDAVWQFLRTFLTKDYQDENVWSLASRKDIFEEKAEEATTIRYQEDADGNFILDENGEKIPIARYSTWDEATGEETEIYAIPEEQIQQLRELISCTSKRANYDSDIFSIVSEQAAAFFQGQKSAEEVAKLIQSKANIFVNEQR